MYTVVMYVCLIKKNKPNPNFSKLKRRYSKLARKFCGAAGNFPEKL